MAYFNKGLQDINQCLKNPACLVHIAPIVQKNSMETEVTFLKIYLRADPLSMESNVTIAPSGTALFPYMAFVDYSHTENMAENHRNVQYL